MYVIDIEAHMGDGLVRRIALGDVLHGTYVLKYIEASRVILHTHNIRRMRLVTSISDRRMDVPLLTDIRMEDVTCSKHIHTSC